MMQVTQGWTNADGVMEYGVSTQSLVSLVEDAVSVLQSLARVQEEYLCAARVLVEHGLNSLLPHDVAQRFADQDVSLGT